MWFDTHCHLTGSDGDISAVLAGAAQHHVNRLLTVGCSVEDSLEAANLAASHDGVWSTAGVHPHEASAGTEGLKAIFSQPKVVAVGECGLDYHYNNSPAATQKSVFCQQIELAHELDLALVIHTREAWDDTFEILDREGIPARTVFHCFTGGPDEAAEALKRGAYLSLSGIVTFPSASELREAAKMAPTNRLVVETDAPYLAPVPHRGKPNHPGLVSVVGEFVAELRGEAAAGFAAQTSANAKRLYGVGAKFDDSTLIARSPQ